MSAVTCTHEKHITLMFGERECLTCGRVEPVDVCPFCEASSARPGDNMHCVYDGHQHAWHRASLCERDNCAEGR